MLKKLKGIEPKVHEDAFVADTAMVIGDVNIGKGTSIWYGTVLRGDIENITIGKYSNIQDNVTVHTETDIPTKIGDYTVVGHNAIVHGCTIGDNCLIGMGAIILNNAKIGDNCIIGAGALVPEGKVIPPNSLVMGVPGKIIRQVTEEEIEAIRENALRYNRLYKKHI
ncbi:gamma carbonic anhydrase family protein [Tepidimicrobium xylanilyticum]|uniref:Carbonic anhydrase or acetyltransferase, isoleucine patch superfamily n=1 Tax=Tepidimicrobium xylanilyticum TaxID=1123352 RepID=A0A1H3A1S0_9FIRM|nr:gamma carbonic anhydrase family protein [Tepidimicrobium xylanilyticum]SDX23720.1 Carbonic anhydrase or acetyltransferase, isoleucine patch superfamily [Tepidimicrobium xylanilyticum]